MNFIVIKAEPNTDKDRPLNFDHIPFTKQELKEAHLVKTRLDRQNLYIILSFEGDDLIVIAPITKSGLPHKRKFSTVHYHDIIEIHKLNNSL